ncbi:hypothetical protein LOTGIDRAFT_141873 [Lottia gigantea]|uniref:Uncharacterized protein n=1 Tax=Lottia gigantea TaxID=225164 RepID=V4AWZ3_LOTGI|nr:hypothetical protein LOTGIDRAFT_141873 [Lottia gigantea]ESO99580.1 hypothetical protein LOTGIDRAFT_141873 [Lottia gigantea]
MFGVLVSGRLPQTDCQQVGETQFMFNIPEADNINHVVVFMTGQTAFPQNLGGAVYFSWPSPSGATSWILLGHISNNKPSAIFKITKLKGNSILYSSNTHPFGQSSASHLAQIGISVEPIEQLAQQTPATASSATNVSSFVEFSQKMLENFVNFASSFAVNQSQMVPNPSETFVPLSTIPKWFENFKRRLEKNPNFWQQ